MLGKRTIPWLLAAAALAGCMARAPRRQLPQTATPARNNEAFEEAMGLVAELKYPEASDKFATIFPRLHATGDTAGAAEAMFWVGYCYEKQGQRTAAANWYKRVVRAYLWEPAASEAAKRLTRLENRH